MKHHKSLQSPIFIFVTTAMIVMILFMPGQGRAINADADSAFITQLRTQIAALQKQIDAIRPQTGDEPTTPPSFNFSRDLSFGIRGDPDVTNLQEFLSEHGYYSGQPTGNFFLLTIKAVKKFQSANGISPTGYFGPKSRVIANDLINKELGGNTNHGCASPISCVVPPAGCAYQNASACSCGVLVCGKKENTLGNLSIESSSAQLAIGESVRIKAMFTPPRPACLDATPRCMIPEQAPYAVSALFTSSDSSVVATDMGTDGEWRVRGISAGSAVITASHNTFTNIFIAKMEVTVGAGANKQGSISIEPSPIAVKTDESVALHTYYQPPMPPCPAGFACVQMMPARIAVDAIYVSDNPAVATVSVVGSNMCAAGVPSCPSLYQIRGVSAGTAVITASYRAKNDAEQLTAQTKVTVTSATNSSPY